MNKNNQKSQSTQQPPSLLKAVFVDLFVRHWLVTLIALLMVVSGMSLALTSHKMRRSTADLEQLKSEYQESQVEWESLRLELTALTEPDRVSHIARKELGMVEVTTKNEKVISL
jgi:cell division protein FtsL